ncbi:TPA: DUF3883 domain-containing protein [Streptococcus suis]|nr:DUF3883 domain-containing protein [Streptococcus suis]
METKLDFLPEPVEGQQAFILDHGKTEDDGQLKYADDATSYGWNIRRYGKLNVGAFVLNRHPGKITKDRKWEIYGGGYVESISDPDADGNVIAKISHAFTIEPVIKQGDSFIENYVWDTPSKKKRKKPNSWEHFWDQYGMNEISFSDFLALLEKGRVIPFDSSAIIPTEADLSENELHELTKDSSKDFTILVAEDGPNRSVKQKKRKFNARKTDWVRVNEAKQKIGALGEEIVFGLLTQTAIDSNISLPEHVSKVEGDGLGYDIRAWDGDGNEIHIEVKTSKEKYSDGFEMSRNEVLASQSCDHYKIYFVYDLDVKTRECKLKIYDGPISGEGYNLEPTSYKVFLK